MWHSAANEALIILTAAHCGLGKGQINDALQDLQQDLLDRPIRHGRNARFAHPAIANSDSGRGAPASYWDSAGLSLQFITDAFPPSVTLTQLRFAPFAGISLR